MNDMAVVCEHASMTASGSLRQADLADLNQALRRNINSARGYQQPIDLARQRLTGQQRPATGGAFGGVAHTGTPGD